MNLPDKTARLLGTLVICACLIMLAGYWLMPGPYWKYGDYTFLCVTGVCGLLVVIIEKRWRKVGGWLVLAASILLGLATFDSRKRHEELRSRLLREAEIRILNQLPNQVSPD
jgi:hypothetical protein